MKTVTIRNIPENIVDSVKTLSKIDRRSINNEFLVLIEAGLNVFISKSANDKKMICLKKLFYQL